MTAPPTPTPVAIRADRCPSNAMNPLTTSIAIDKSWITTVSTLLAGRCARQRVCLNAAGSVQNLFLSAALGDQSFESRLAQCERDPREQMHMPARTRTDHRNK